MAYFYCAFSVTESLISTNIFGSLLAQLCTVSPSALARVSELYSTHLENSSSTSRARGITEAQIADLIVQSLQGREEIFLLLDGINECEDPQVILDGLAKIIGSCSECSVHLFISSINEKDIGSAMEALPNVMMETLRQVDIQNDVRSLVLSTLETDPRLRRQSPELKKEIDWALTQGAKGMYAAFQPRNFVHHVY